MGTEIDTKVIQRKRKLIEALKDAQTRERQVCIPAFSLPVLFHLMFFFIYVLFLLQSTKPQEDDDEVVVKGFALSSQLSLHFSFILLLD